MTAIRFRGWLWWLACVCLWSDLPAHAQPVSDLPRAEYYVARELFHAGRTLEAGDGFQAALNRSRRMGERRWIDSIPPLVMLGECYHQQGNLAMALEQYDAALMLALANPSWIDQIEIPTEQLAELDVSSKGINWFAKSRPTRTLLVPAALQIAVDPTQAQTTPQGAVVAPISLVSQLDVTEVLRTMGIALLRRWEVLGPLAKHSPLAAPLDAMLARNPAQQVPWLMASWRSLRGLAGLSSNPQADNRQLLAEGILIANQADYYLSSLALLTLGKLDARAGNYSGALVSFQDATLLAAQFEQLAIVAEALEEGAACGAIMGRSDLLGPLQRLASWANKKGALVPAAALIGAGEIAIVGNDLVLADKLLRQAAASLRSREIKLPRSQAKLTYTAAQLALAQNRRTLGLSNLENSLKFMRGTASTGAVVESVFRTQLTLDLLAANALTAAQAEPILVDAVAEPSGIDWELDPMKTLAELTTAREPAYTRLLELAVARAAEPEEILQLMDRIQRQRLYEALPLGGRLHAWREALGGLPARLSATDRRVVEVAVQRNGSLLSMGQQIETLIGQLKHGPLPLDERKLSADSKKAYAALEEVSANFESQLALLSLQRRPLSRIAPTPAALTRVQQPMQAGDLVIAMVVGGAQIYGVAIAGDQTHLWRVGEANKLEGLLSGLLTEFGLARGGKPATPAAALAPTAAWRATAEKLSAFLFPVEVQNLLAQSRRVIMIPHDRLWYVPYEALPLDAAAAGGAAWIVDRQVTYVPTLGTIAMAFGQRPALKSNVGIVGSFFALDPPSNDLAADAIASSLPNPGLVLLSQKLSVPAAGWLKLTTDLLWTAAAVEAIENSWDTPVLPLGQPQQAPVGLWLETPRTSPAVVVLPGLGSGLKQGKLGRGDELFLPVCAMLFSGTKSTCVSRWPVGGSSAKVFLQRELEELQFEQPSAALRRSILAQWTEQFLLAEEPILLPAVKEAPVMIPGSHPLLWAGYMCVGDWLEQPNP